jgi:hypothetical protein
MKKYFLFIITAASLMMLWSLSFDPEEDNLNSWFTVYLNQNRLEALSSEIDLNDVNKVFSLIFSKLDDRVNVYPTENYYYFIFYANGKEIWGNIRLPREERDLGILSFAYWEFDNFPQQMEDPNYFSKSRRMGLKDSVSIIRNSPFEYSVSYNGKTVIFQLNQLEQKLRESITLRKGEMFLMRTCDESGLQFFLLFNKKSDDFLFVLDEVQNLREEFIPLEEDFLFGKRTQFVFYNDTVNKRKILVGVFAENIKRNNYYDGPFDQLADNYIDTTTGLQECIDQAYSYASGRVNEFGAFIDSNGNPVDIRLAITPYYTYYSMEDLLSFIENIEDKEGDELYSYLVYDYKKSVPK